MILLSAESKPASALFPFSRECYAHTQSSLSLLEAVCRCVQMGEPVLLVGETGVGKTSTVSYMARMTGVLRVTSKARCIYMLVISD